MTPALFLLALLTIKHFICDWWIQSYHPYQYLNKGKYLHPGGLLHAFIAVLGTLIAVITSACLFFSDLFEGIFVVFFALPIWKVLLFEFLFHYHVDYLKIKVNEYFKLEVKDPGFWTMIGLDQALHYLSYIFMIVWLLK